jgi:hypothetical protein
MDKMDGMDKNGLLNGQWTMDRNGLGADGSPATYTDFTRTTDQSDWTDRTDRHNALRRRRLTMLNPRF